MLRYFKLVTLGFLFAFPLLASSTDFDNSVRSQHPAVVPIIHPLGRSTGFFVTPDTIVTNFHNIWDLAGFQIPMKDNLFFIDSEKKPIPITTVLSVNAEYDLAVLKIQGYSHPSFYPVSSFSRVNSKVKSQKAVIVGFPEGSFQFIEGKIISENLEQKGFLKMEIPDKDMDGFSGSPILLNGQIIGVHHATIDNNESLFTSLPTLQAMLSKTTPSSVSPSVLIEEEMKRLVSLVLQSEDQQTKKTLQGILQSYTEKTIGNMEQIDFFKKYKDFQNKVLVDGVKILPLFANYYESFQNSNKEKQIHDNNMLFQMAIKAGWANALRVNEKYQLRCMMAFSPR